MSEWYYMYGGQQQGPVRGSQLKSLAASGSLGPDDLVWNQSLPEWTPAKRVRGLTFPAVASGHAPAAPYAAPAAQYAAPEEQPPETYAPAEAAADYAQYPQQTEYGQPAQSAPAQYAPGDYAPQAMPPVAGEGVSPVALRMLQQSCTWMLVVTIFLFVMAGLLLLVAVFTIIGAMRVIALANSSEHLRFAAPAMGMVIVTGIITVLEGGAVLVLGLFLAKYLGAIKRVTATKRAADLDSAMTAHKTFWTVAGILSLVAAGLIVAMVVLTVISRASETF